MRSAWKLTKLGNLLTIQNGFAFNSKNFSESKGVPLIRIRDLKNGRTTETNYLGSFDRRYVVRAGDFLIGMDGEFGCYEWKGEPALLNQRVCRLQEFSDKLDPRFIFYGINKYLKHIEHGTSYATVKHLSSKQISNIEIPLPPFPEQQRIVTILDEAFDGLAIATANAERNLKNARELFDTYLNSTFDSKIGVWPTKSLEQLCESERVITYGVIKLGKEISDGVPCLRTSNVRWLRIDTGGIKRISPALSNNFSRTILRGGEVLVAVRGSLGGVAVATYEMKGWNVSREVAMVPVDSNQIEPEYLAYFIARRRSQDWLNSLQKGAAYIGINISDLRTLPISFPAKEEQAKLISKFRSLSAETRVLEAGYAERLSRIGDLRQSILGAAFGGELTSPPSSAIQEAAE